MSAAGVPTTSAGRGRRVTDVVVVGGGVSGLVCARELHDAGLDVVVLEASGRLGGRVLTHREAGGAVELGAQWVADGHLRLLALLADHGLGLRRPPRRGRAVHVDDRGRRVLPAWRASLGGLTALRALDLAAASARLALRARRGPTAADAGTSTGRWLAEACATPAARHVLAAGLEAATCRPVSEVSLAWVLDQVRRCDGLRGLADIEQQVVVGGLGALVDSLAAPLDVRWRRPVLGLRREDAAWRVGTAAGAVRARHVVLATPPSSTDRLLPPPPGPRPRPGSVLKVVARYHRPFWRDEGRSGLATHLGPAAVVTGTVDAGEHAPGSPGHLVGFVTGSAARRLAGHPAPEQRAAVLEDLVLLHGPAAAHPLDLLVHDWSREPWTPGGYTWPSSPGARLERERSSGSDVHLAGSERAERWPGFVEGAVRAGQAAAASVRGGAAACRRP